jgi:hypothetical protein
MIGATKAAVEAWVPLKKIGGLWCRDHKEVTDDKELAGRV